jgi:hypothetical protein
MKKFNDYETTQSYSNSEKLPVGGYVLKIANVRYEEGKNGASDRIQLMFDIAEGEQKDFFRKQYEAQTSEDKKWKGTVAIYVPTDDGSEKDGWTKKSFKTIMENFEASNPGYTWNWDENSLKGKLIGGIFVDTYSVIDGKEISYVSLAPKNIRSVDCIRSGNFKMPEAIYKNGATGNVSATNTSSNSFVNIPSGSAEEIPF